MSANQTGHPSAQDLGEAFARDKRTPPLIDPHRFSATTGFAPAQGGELKNIRRCLKAPKPDATALASTIVASLTATLSALRGAFPVPTGGPTPWWTLLLVGPIGLAVGAVAVASMRYAKALDATKDEHLKAAQEDADRYIAWQDEAQQAVNNRLIESMARESSVPQ